MVSVKFLVLFLAGCQKFFSVDDDADIALVTFPAVVDWLMLSTHVNSAKLCHTTEREPFGIE